MESHKCFRIGTIIKSVYLVVMKTCKIIAYEKKKVGFRDLASKTDISQVMVGKYERGDAIPSMEVGEKNADAFGVSLDYLVCEGQC